jgi:hypothetical protein
VVYDWRGKCSGRRGGGSRRCAGGKGWVGVFSLKEGVERTSSRAIDERRRGGLGGQE